MAVGVARAFWRAGGGRLGCPFREGFTHSLSCWVIWLREGMYGGGGCEEVALFAWDG